jgi:hypothetical protein
MKGLPLRVYLDLEAARKPTGFEDIFIGYHANDDVQVTYAGKSFHSGRSYHVSTEKTNVSPNPAFFTCITYTLHANISNYALLCST